MKFFGEYDQRPFEPSHKTEGYSDEDRHRHVAKKMADARFRGRALGQCWQSGAGEYSRLYTLEHAYSELPFVVVHQVQEVMEKRAKPVPTSRVFLVPLGMFLCAPSFVGLLLPSPFYNNVLTTRFSLLWLSLATRPTNVVDATISLMHSDCCYSERKRLGCPDSRQGSG